MWEEIFISDSLRGNNIIRFPRLSLCLYLRTWWGMSHWEHQENTDKSQHQTLCRPRLGGRGGWRGDHPWMQVRQKRGCGGHSLRRKTFQGHPNANPFYINRHHHRPRPRRQFNWKTHDLSIPRQINWDTHTNTWRDTNHTKNLFYLE